MTRTGDRGARVLVVCCPQWPAPGSGAAAAPAGRAGRQARGAAGPGPEERAFEQVVLAVEDFCPQVEVLRPGACAIGARGPARYFGGEEALGAKIIAAVAGRGFGCQAGVADGLFAAQLAARAAAPGAVMIVPAGQARSFLGPLPVSVLGDEELAGLLPRLGIATLAEYAALPAQQAVNRFGTAGAAAHRLARGLGPRPLAPRPPSADLSVSAGFDPPAASAEPVVFAAKALAGQMQAGLSARGLACVRVRVQARWENGQESSRLWRHDGLLSALAVAERVRWQLAGWQDQHGPGAAGSAAACQAADGAGAARDRIGGDTDARDTDARDTDARDRVSAAGNGAAAAAAAGNGNGNGAEVGDGDGVGGITLLRLVPDQLVRAEARQLGLWGDTVVSDRVARAAVGVQAMLGHGAVTRPLPAGGRSPGEQVTLTPFGDITGPARPADQPWPGRIPAPAPATVYPDPLPARVTDEAGAAVTVTGRALVSAPPARLSAAGAPWQDVTAWAGPWPVSERWWDPGSARRRARFQLVTADGSGWLVALADGRWLVEGRYD